MTTSLKLSLSCIIRVSFAVEIMKRDPFILSTNQYIKWGGQELKLYTLTFNLRNEIKVIVY